MAKTFVGKITSVKMQDTAIVEVVRRVPHKLYKKLMKRSKNFKVDTKGFEVALDQDVKFVETKPMSKDKFFKIVEIIERK